MKNSTGFKGSTLGSKGQALPGVRKKKAADKLNEETKKMEDKLQMLKEMMS